MYCHLGYELFRLAGNTLIKYAVDLRCADATQQPDARVVIVDIDEASLAAVGRWPWSRNQLAQLVDMLFDHYQIRALGFDMVFAEADSRGL